MKKYMIKVWCMIMIILTLTGCQSKNVEKQDNITEQTEETEQSYTEWPESFGKKTDEVLMQIVVDSAEEETTLRTGPGEKFGEIQKIENGEILDVYVQTQTQDWYGVKYGENYGWVSALEVSKGYDEVMFEQYAQVLQDYYDVYMGKSVNSVSELSVIGEGYLNISGKGALGDSEDLPYFSLCDINGDNKPELFISADLESVDIYTYHSQSICHLINDRARYFVELLENGNICTTSSIGGGDISEICYSINENGELVFVAGKREHYVAGDTIEEYYCKILENEEVAISEEEYAAYDICSGKQVVNPPFTELTQEQIDNVKQGNVEIYGISDAKPKDLENKSENESTNVSTRPYIDATVWPVSFGAQTDTVLYQVIVDAPDGYVNLRSGAGIDNEIIEPISNGEVLDVYVETDSYKWCGVKHGNNYGWVAVSQISYIDYKDNGELVYIKQKIFNQEEINFIKEQLNVPLELEATVTINRSS